MGLKFLKEGLKLENLKDGHYHFMIDKIDQKEGFVYAIRNLNVSWNEAKRKNWIIQLPLEGLRKVWFGELRKTIAGFHIQVSENGNKVEYRQVMGRRMRMREGRATVMAQILAEEFGSVDRFMDENNIGIESGSDEEQIYRQLRSGQKEYFNDVEDKLIA